MRFDDTLTTVIGTPVDNPGAKAAVWMQIVDILAQDRGTIDPGLRETAVSKVTEWRDEIPAATRLVAAKAVSFHCQSPALVALFGGDQPAIAAPVLNTARLSVAQWEELLPKLPLPSRALLRERRDLPTDVSRMLSAYGPSDLALPVAEAAVSSETLSQITELVARIEAYRKDRSEPDFARESEAEVSAFRFETGADGLIHWVEDAPRGSIIGIELGAMAEIGEHGVDGHAAGAFRRRTPFRNARMRVPGQGPASGDWLISGLPVFDQDTGKFEGFRCTARRSHRDERPQAIANRLVSQGLPPDSLRQLIHELRTPLNAIRGFAEMISAQLLGPISSSYRGRAEAIIGDARKLLAMFDDLDVAARIERGAFDGRSAAGVDAVAVLRSLASELAPAGSEHHARLQVRVATDLPSVLPDLVTTERLFSRLLSATLSATRDGDLLIAELQQDGAAVVLRVNRPATLARISAQELFDPSREMTEDARDGPPLGLGFAMRLIDSMAVAVGAQFIVDDHTFLLRLPTIASNGAAESSK